VETVIANGYDALVLGAAITAGPEREADDPESILRVNLLAQTPILIAARRSGVRRIINLSSAAAYGASAFRNALLDEETPCDPASLYAITKFASEKVAARLAGLWQCEIISVRLSAVFGPWERGNDVRDTPSPQAQILAAMQEGYQAVLSRPGVRDWIYAVDVAEAVTLLIEAAKPMHQLYNISTGVEWSALQWGQKLAALHPGFLCRLTDAGEVATVDLHSPADRAPLSVARMADEFGWRARFGCADSAADLSRWWIEHRGGNLT
jgi:UDP-glucose 4-epimerase